MNIIIIIKPLEKTVKASGVLLNIYNNYYKDIFRDNILSIEEQVINYIFRSPAQPRLHIG